MKVILLLAALLGISQAYRLTHDIYGTTLRDNYRDLFTDRIYNNDKKFCKVIVHGVLVFGDCDLIYTKFHDYVDLKNYYVDDTFFGDFDLYFKDKVDFMCVDRFCDKIFIKGRIVTLYNLFDYCYDKHCVIDFFRNKLMYFTKDFVNTDVLGFHHNKNRFFFKDGVYGDFFTHFFAKKDHNDRYFYDRDYKIGKDLMHKKVYDDHFVGTHDDLIRDKYAFGDYKYGNYYGRDYHNIRDYDYINRYGKDYLYRNADYNLGLTHDTKKFHDYNTIY